MNNLELWDKVREVPKNAQKSIGGGRLKGMTDINPMWRIKELTANYGLCGVGWKYVITSKRLENGASDEIAAFVDIDLFIKVGDKWSDAIQGTGGNMFVTKETRGLHTSDECFKMALTDAISVACKALGFGADIYWQEDRTKYDKNTDEPVGSKDTQKFNNKPIKRGNTPIETMKTAVKVFGEDVAQLCIKEYLASKGFERSSQIPDDKYEEFEKWVNSFKI